MRGVSFRARIASPGIFSQFLGRGIEQGVLPCFSNASSQVSRRTSKYILNTFELEYLQRDSLQPLWPAFSTSSSFVISAFRTATCPALVNNSGTLFAKNEVASNFGEGQRSMGEL